MKNVFLLAGLTFRDSIRNKALYGIFALGTLLFLGNVIITSMFNWELGKVAVDIGLSVVSLSGLIIIFFFSIHMVSYDLERKTIYLILSKPISKYQYVLGKFLGLAAIVVVSSVFLGFCSYASVKLAMLDVVSIPQNFSWLTFFISLIYQSLSLLIVLAIAFICIGVTTHAFTAVLLCMMCYFIGQNVENVFYILSRGQLFSESPHLMWIMNTISWIFPNLAAFDLKTSAAYGLSIDPSYLGWIGIYGISYIAACLILAMFFFYKRELG